MKLRKIIAVFIAAVLAAGMSACRKDYTKEGGEITTADIESLKALAETTIVENEIQTDEPVIVDDSDAKLVLDREGILVKAPKEVNKIASGSERITQLLIDLGLGGKIAAADKDSASVMGISPSICTLNKKIITASALEDIEPDVVILSGTSADTVYSTLKNSGVNVICVPDSTTIESVKLDIEFLAAYLSVEEKGKEIIDEIDTAVNTVTEKAAGVPIRKVYFEEQAIPEFKAYGDNTLAFEIVSLAGGTNAFAGQSGISPVTSENVIAANPDIILTTVSYDGYDINEIPARTGWSAINAVKTNSIRPVSVVSSTASITDSIYEIAKAVYPELYTE
ncbi:MAG: ABC transporter substrate-binding protein [Oscillospiraceae bacterium]|nr:ABC transporter substrate-binding protein [Oscillospiraceae bacterium]